MGWNYLSIPKLQWFNHCRWGMHKKFHPCPLYNGCNYLSMLALTLIHVSRGDPGGRFKNVYELLNLRALKISVLYKNHIFQCMGKIFCVEFQRVPYPYIDPVSINNAVYKGRLPRDQLVVLAYPGPRAVNEKLDDTRHCEITSHKFWQGNWNS